MHGQHSDALARVMIKNLKIAEAHRTGTCVIVMLPLSCRQAEVRPKQNNRPRRSNLGLLHTTSRLTALLSEGVDWRAPILADGYSLFIKLV